MQRTKDMLQSFWDGSRLCFSSLVEFVVRTRGEPKLHVQLVRVGATSTDLSSTYTEMKCGVKGQNTNTLVIKIARNFLGYPLLIKKSCTSRTSLNRLVSVYRPGQPNWDF